jgi:hypothetical protein
MDKFRILSKCEYCQGKAYLPEGEAEDYVGRKYVRYRPCPRCKGTGMAAKWVAFAEFRELLEQSESTKESVVR